MNSNINDIKIGHWTDKENKTGCTAIISDVPLIASIDITRIFFKNFAFKDNAYLADAPSLTSPRPTMS